MIYRRWQIPCCSPKAYPEELRFYGGDCTGRGTSVKKGVVERSRKYSRQRAQSRATQAATRTGGRIPGNSGILYTHFPCAENAQPMCKIHTSRAQNTRFPCTEYTLPVCKVHTTRVQSTHFPCAKYTLPAGILPCLPGNARSPEPQRLQHVPAAEYLATQVPSHLPCAKYAHLVHKIHTFCVQNTHFPCAKYTLSAGILPCLLGNARSPEPHRLQHVPAAEYLATQVPSHLPCAKYAHPVYKIHASRVQNTHSRARNTPFQLESSPAFPATRAIPSHIGCDTRRRQNTWQLRYLVKEIWKLAGLPPVQNDIRSKPVFMDAAQLLHSNPYRLLSPRTAYICAQRVHRTQKHRKPKGGTSPPKTKDQTPKSKSSICRLGSTAKWQIVRRIE